MGLRRGGEDSKQSDCDCDCEAEDDESVERVAAGFTLMEAVQPFRVPDGAPESDGVGEIVVEGLPNVFDEECGLDAATGRFVHSIRTR